MAEEQFICLKADEIDYPDFYLYLINFLLESLFIISIHLNFIHSVWKWYHFCWLDALSQRMHCKKF